jgi:hypothetical protein
MTADELAAKVAARYPADRMSAVALEHGTGNWAKFFDVATYAKRATTKAHEWGLLAQPRNKAILDIGAGLGYFATAAVILGHKAAAIEVNHPITHAIYSGQYYACRQNGEPHVSYALFKVLAQQPLIVTPPSLPGPYDLITLFGVNFCKNPLPGKREFFDEADYRFLVADLWARLAPGGIIGFEFNWGEETRLLETMEFDQPFSRERNVIKIGPKP